MTTVVLILRWLLTIAGAFLCGKVVSKFKIPAILGWLIGGMLLGPYTLNVLPTELINTWWYSNIIHIMEVAVGYMIGVELVWNQLKNYGKALIVTTLFESFSTFALVSVGLGIIFQIVGIPIYLAFVFGGIALATAPLPALSIVREFKTKGPVTRTLVPMSAIDNIIAVSVFFTVISLVARTLSGGEMSLIYVPIMILLPLIIGAVVGIPLSFALKKAAGALQINAILLLSMILIFAVGNFCNTYLMPKPLLNYMLMGTAFAAVYANVVSIEKLKIIKKDFTGILWLSNILVIINLGAPLDFHAVLGAGVYTVIYIVARSFGKYGGARVGATITNMEPTVRKYLGLTLLPHSGVSLVFTGIASSMLVGPEPGLAKIISGTIAAAAIINEIIAVIVAKKGFEWAGELNNN